MKPTARVREGAIHLLCYAAATGHPLDVAARDLGAGSRSHRLAESVLWVAVPPCGVGFDWLGSEKHYLYAAELLINESPR